MRALLDLVRVLYEPATVFARLRDRPRVLVPLLAIVGASLAVGILTIPYVKAGLGTILAQLSAARGKSPPELGRAALTQVVLSTAGMTISLPITAAILWTGVLVAGGEGHYRAMLSLTAYTAVVSVLQQAAALTVLAIGGLGSIGSPADLHPSLGLDLLVPTAAGPVGAALRYVTPFSVWRLVLNAIGIKTTHRTSTAAAYGIAGAAFLVGVLWVSLVAFVTLRPEP